MAYAQHQNTEPILVVEDDPDIGIIIAQAIQYETPFDPVLLSDGPEALHYLHRTHPAALVLDYNLPSMTGIELYDHLRTLTRGSVPPTVLITAYTQQCQREARQRHLPLVSKPFDLDNLLQTIEQMIDHESRL